MGILKKTLLTVLATLGGSAVLYFGMLGALISIPSLQTQVLYLHGRSLTWPKDLNVPEQFGFLHKQVTPFNITTGDGETLFAWHVLPLGVYRRNYEDLTLGDDQPAGESDKGEPLSLRLLRDDPEARLVIFFHGVAGTVGADWRPHGYRALYSAAPEKIHVLAFDPRGYGLSTGTPSEPGLITDAIAVYKWATNVAKIPPERIVLFGHSLGTGPAIALAEHLAGRTPPVSPAGVIISSSFTGIANLTSTYRINKRVPVLSPIASIPALFDFFARHINHPWLNKDRIGGLVRKSGHYYINFLHSEDDTDIPHEHTDVLVWHALNATRPEEDVQEETPYHVFSQEKKGMKKHLSDGGWFVEWHTDKGLIRQDSLKHGTHDNHIAYPAVALAVFRAFQGADPTF